MTRPFVTAVVVNWNGERDLRDELPSLCAQAYSSLEILVMDNGSTDGSAEVAASFPVQWVPLGANLGLAAALNEGARRSRGEYVLFLNNDMRFPPDFVERLVEVLDADESLFAVDALQFNWDGTRKIHGASTLSRTHDGDPLTETLVPGLYLRQSIPDRPVISFMSSCASMLVRRDRFLELGGFDPVLPIAYEDTELSWRAWMRGWPTAFTPQAVVWHRVGAASQTLDGQRRRLRGTLLGRLVFATRLLPASTAWRVWASTTAGLAKAILTLNRGGAADRANVLARGLRLLPRVLADRRKLHRTAGVTPSDVVARLLRPTPYDAVAPRETIKTGAPL